MSPQILFLTHLFLGYVPWLLCFGVYIWPRLKAMDHVGAQRAIAALHSFRFFGLAFILPGVVGPNLPAGFATFVRRVRRIWQLCDRGASHDRAARG